MKSIKISDVANNADNSALEIDIIKQSKEWEVAFGDMELMSTNSLQKCGYII